MPQLPDFPEPPNIHPVEYGALFALPIAGAFIGLLVFFPVIFFVFCPFFCSGGFRETGDSLLFGLPTAGAVIGLVLGAFTVASQLGTASDAKRKYQRQKAAYEAAVADKARKEHEAKEIAHNRYVRAYAEYLPKWQAWHKSLEAPRQQAAALQAWRAMLPEYARRATQAAIALDRLFHAVDTRARVQLGLHNMTDIYSLYREAVKAASQAHPDLGLLRLPRWQGLLELAPLAPALSALPPFPRDVLQEVPAPVFPQRPTPPPMLVFHSDYDAPLPVERVRL